jgi:predicted deacylase
MATALPTVDVITAAHRGPTVGILGGVHGDEYEGVLAATRLRSELRAELLCGEVRIAAPAHPAAWTSRSRNSPVDGQDLARVFPGRPHGDPTENVAHFLTEQLIGGADFLIDLHSAGSGFDMPLLCGYHDGEDRRGSESRRLAEAFAAPFTWAHEGTPAPGRSLSAAFDLGVPAVYAECHGGRSVRADDLLGLLHGVRRVLHALGMLSGAPPSPYHPVRVHGDGDTDAGIVSPIAGFLVSHRRPGAFVRKGETIIEVVQPDGAPGRRIGAPHDGFVMLLRRDARVSTGQTICIVASVSDEP